MTKDPDTGNWRIRKRTRDFYIDQSTGISDLVEARRWARILLDNRLDNQIRLRTGGHTLEEIAATYLAFPKNVRDYVAKENVACLRRVVREGMGKELADVQARDVGPTLWERYAAARQGGTLDYSTPRRENISIASCLRSAASIFCSKLDRRYRDTGIVLDFPALRCLPSLPVPQIRKSPVPASTRFKLLAAWCDLKATNPALYTTIGLALHAGLRSSEIRAAGRHWVEKTGVSVRVVVRDRLEEGFRTKGKSDGAAWVSGLVLDEEFAQHLLDLPDGKLITGVGEGDWFFGHVVNRWVRQFIPLSLDTKGLHRLRGMYADTVKEKFEEQILARATAIDAARLALGHSSAAITLEHYLTPQ